MTNSILAKALPFAAERAQVVPAAFGAMFLGLVMMYGIGFAPIDIVHNAAHDGRHVFAYPCH